MIKLFQFHVPGACLPFLLVSLFGVPIALAKSKPITFGPTGISGDMHPGWPKKSEAIKVVACEKDSPADGKLKQGDIIVGVGGERFQTDPYPGLTYMIDDAEKAGGKLTLLLETGEQVVIELPNLGSYSPTAPYDCPKTEKIIASAIEGILASERIGQSPTRTDLLGLLATGEKRCIDVVAKLIKKDRLLDIDPQEVEDILSGAKIDGGPVTAGWGWGYNLITLGEYYLLTKDASVLPLIRTYALGLARGQDASGCWGHRMMTADSGNRLPGYAQMNQPSVSNFMAMLIARKCGIEDPVLDQAIERSYAYVADHAGKGGFPYGVGGPAPENFNNNGMSGAAAICMSLYGDQSAARYFSQCAATSYDTLTQGHASPFFNPLWTPAGAALSGPEVTQQFFRKSLWYFNGRRHFTGGFPGTDNVGNFNGQALLMYCLPRKALLITGREADPSIWVKGDEATEVIMMSQLADETKSADELLKLLDHPFPQVPERVSRILMERTGAYRRVGKKDDFTAKIMAAIDNGNPRERANAIACFGPRCNRDFSAPYLEKIGAILRDETQPFQVRLAAASALGSGTFGDGAQPYHNDVLKLMFAERPPMNDPFMHVDTKIGEALDGICGEPFAAGLVTDKDLFYKVSLRLMGHKRQKARSAGIKMLRGMPIGDFARIGAPFMVAVENKDPSYESYHNVQDTVALGVEVLANLRIREGLDVLLETTMSPGGKWGFKKKMLHHALPLYGGNAKPYITKFEQHPNLPGRGKSLKNWEDLVKAIEEDKDPQELVSLTEALRMSKGE